MKMTQVQRDALQEIANIGISSASTQLSELMNKEILMDIPEVDFTTPDKIECLISPNRDENMGVIVQELGGELNGTAHFVLISEESTLLVHSLLDNLPPIDDGETDTGFYEQEALEEIGNIVISSCISEFADQLKNEVTLSVPSFIEGRFVDIFSAEEKEGSVVLTIKTTLTVSEKNIKGMIIIMLTIESAEKLLKSLAESIALMDAELSE